MTKQEIRRKDARFLTPEEIKKIDPERAKKIEKAEDKAEQK